VSAGRPLARRPAAERLASAHERLRADRSATTVPLDAIAGRFLAEPVVADGAIPAHDTATMDGFALDATESFPLTVVDGPVYPEDEPPALEPGTAVRVATGAPLPAGATAVLKREDATVTDGRLTGPSLDPGTNVYPRGSNVAADERVFDAGERLTPQDAALLRDVGRDRVAVADRFAVGVLATGTEIHEGVQPDRDSEMLANVVRAWGHEPTLTGSVPDERERVREAVADLAADHEIVVTSGGTSVGEKDCAVAALDDLGTLLFRGVELRPGRPVTAARLDGGGVAVALPGKPVAAWLAAVLVARALFVGRPATRPLPTLTATLARDLPVPDAPFEYAVPVTLTDDGVMPLGHVDSALPLFADRFRPGRLASSTRATRADAVWLTDADGTAGQDVAVVPVEVLE
jgi:molybdopterin molybdotransferase